MSELTGLTSQEVAQREAKGQVNNVNLATSRSYWDIIRHNVFNFLNIILLLIGFALISFGRWNDAIASTGLVFLNIAVSVAQEIRAKRKLDQIALLSRPRINVLRDGAEVEIDPARIVKDDLVVVEPGDQIVVDGPVVGTGEAFMDESLLTGESDLVLKREGDELLSGSFCVTGKLYYRAEKIGEESYANKLTQTARKFQVVKTPMQKDVDFVIRILIASAGFLAFILFMVGAWFLEVSDERLVQATAVIVGQIPYGLFFIVGVTYALAAVRIAEKGALTQQLNAVEALSNVDILCTDKTGTLTTNRIQYEQLVPLSATDYPAETVSQWLGTFARSATLTNATSEAVINGLDGFKFPFVDEVTFSSARKWSALTFDQPQMRGAFVLGAPTMLEAYFPADTNLTPQIEAWAAQGLRVLVFAYSPETTQLNDENSEPHLPPLTPLALLSFSDELRPDTQAVLESFAQVGVTVKIISGDDPRTVAALAKQAGLPDDIGLVSGPELEMVPDEMLTAVAEKNTIFGRISPQQKERLVDALKAGGHTVAMMGDGVNDVLSLKKADVGISMQSGSGATRGVADIVLLNDSFAALRPAFIEGKSVVSGLIDNIRMFLARAFASALLIVAISMTGLGFAFTPAQLALTFFYVGFPPLLIAIWARPEKLAAKPMRLIMNFAIPAAVITALFGVVIYTGFFVGAFDQFVSSSASPELIAEYAAEQGIQAETPEQITRLTAEIIAQTALAAFTTFVGLLIIVFIEPPVRFLAGGDRYSGDIRPTLTAVGMTIVVFIVFANPGLRRFFSLAEIGAQGLILTFLLALICGALQLLVWRRHWFEKFFALEPLKLEKETDALWEMK
ncbi:MAG: HAD-IC family P-type ATPase [Anaerolineales bacterium]|nr:HAD-IC family P-type ATPase [Anaerolineales bacterium]